MADYLPPPIMAMFRPRPPLEFKPPIEKRKLPPYTGVAAYVQKLKEYNYPPPVKQETPRDRREKRKKARLEAHAEQQRAAIAAFDPKHPDKDNMTKDAYKTLFVGRLSYKITAEDLKKEFEYYGRVANAVLVQDRDGKSRGYGFVEFESSRDLKEAYKDADGAKIGGRRIVVDVERGRTVEGWKPRRLGGGLGGTRRGGKDVNQRNSGREQPRRSERDRARGRSRERDRGGGRRDDYRGGGGGGRRDDRRRRRSSRSRDRDGYRGGGRRDDDRGGGGRRRDEYRGRHDRDYSRRDRDRDGGGRGDARRSRYRDDDRDRRRRDDRRY